MKVVRKQEEVPLGDLQDNVADLVHYLRSLLIMFIFTLKIKIFYTQNSLRFICRLFLFAENLLILRFWSVA